MSEPHKGRVLETHFAKTHPEAELQVSGSVTRPADSGLTGHQSGVAPFADGQVHSSLTRDKSGSFVVLTGINHIRPAYTEPPQQGIFGCQSLRCLFQ